MLSSGRNDTLAPHLELSPSPASVDPIEIGAMVRSLAADAASYSERVRKRDVGQYRLPKADMVLYIAYGQSNSVGFECWPALSRSTHPGCVMLGGSVHSRYRTRPIFETMDGTLRFSPLRARVRETGEDAGLVPEEAESAIPEGAKRPGETPLEGMLTTLRQAWLRRQAAIGAEVGVGRFGAAAVGVGGQTVEALSGDLFERFRGCLGAWKAACSAEGLSFAVGGILWHQGETDYSRKAETPFDIYVRRLTDLIERMRGEAASVTGQPEAIPIFMVQTGARSVPRNNDLSVGRAQLSVAATVPGVFIVANQQRYPGKASHLSTNGARWLGNQAGRVAAAVQIDGEGWEPTRLLAARHRGTTILASAHAPVPPLQLAPTFRDLNMVLLDTGGLQAMDAKGLLWVSPVQIVADQVLAWTTRRPIVGPLALWLGRQKRTAATINIADSDATLLPGCYEYTPGSGQSPAESHPELNGRPYDARNVAVADILDSIEF